MKENDILKVIAYANKDKRAYDDLIATYKIGRVWEHYHHPQGSRHQKTVLTYCMEISAKFFDYKTTLEFRENEDFDINRALNRAF